MDYKKLIKKVGMADCVDYFTASTYEGLRDELFKSLLGNECDKYQIDYLDDVIIWEGAGEYVYVHGYDIRPIEHLVDYVLKESTQELPFWVSIDTLSNYDTWLASVRKNIGYSYTYLIYEVEKLGFVNSKRDLICVMHSSVECEDILRKIEAVTEERFIKEDYEIFELGELDGLSFFNEVIMNVELSEVYLFADYHLLIADFIKED